MELKFIGTGSCFNFDRGNNSAYMKWGENNESMLLIDCGCDVCEKIVRNHLLDGVENLYIAITHLHDDHSGSLGQLIDYCYYVKSIIVNVIYPPQNTIEVMLSTKMVSINEYKFYGCYSYTNEGTSWFRLGNRGPEIKFIPANHKERYKAFSILLSDDEDNIILYTGDTNNLDINAANDMFINHAEKFKVYTECTFTTEFSHVHIYYKRLFEIPEEYRKNVTVMHLDDDPEKIQELREAGFNIAESELKVYSNTIHKISPNDVEQFALNSYRSNINNDIEIVLPIRVPSYITEEKFKEILSSGMDRERFNEMLKYKTLWVGGVEPDTTNVLLYTSQYPCDRICRIVDINIEKLEAMCIFEQECLDRFVIDKNNLASYEIEFLVLGNFIGGDVNIQHLTYPVLKLKEEPVKQEDETIEVELPIVQRSISTRDVRELFGNTNPYLQHKKYKIDIPEIKYTESGNMMVKSNGLYGGTIIDINGTIATCIFNKRVLEDNNIDINKCAISFMGLNYLIINKTIIGMKDAILVIDVDRYTGKYEELKKELKDPKDHDIQVSTGTIKDIITHPEKYEDMFKEE